MYGLNDARLNDDPCLSDWALEGWVVHYFLEDPSKSSLQDRLRCEHYLGWVTVA